MRSNLTTAQTKWLPPKHLQQLPHLLHGPQQLDGHLGSHHCLSKRRCIAGCRIGGAGRRAAGAHSSSQALDCTHPASVQRRSGRKAGKGAAPSSQAGWPACEKQTHLDNSLQSRPEHQQADAYRLPDGSVCTLQHLRTCTAAAAFSGMLYANPRHEIPAHLHCRRNLLRARPALRLATADLLQAQRVVLRR